MGDYNLPVLDLNSTADFTKEFQTNGDYGLKITSTSSNSYAGILFNNSEYSGKTILLSADVKTENLTWRLEILCYANGVWGSATYVNITNGISWQKIQQTIPLNATRVFFRLRQVAGISGDIIYSDNWVLKEI